MSRPASMLNAAGRCRSESPDSPVVAGVLGRPQDSGFPESRKASAADPGNEDTLRRAELVALASAINRPQSALYALRQVHGTQAHRVGQSKVRSQSDATAGMQTTAQENGDWARGTGDALFSDVPGTVLVIRTADCLPVFFDLQMQTTYPEASGHLGHMVGLIHAGWRGLAAGIVKSTLRRALTEFRQAYPAAQIISARVWCGPAISGPRYEVSSDVAAHFTEKEPGAAADKFLVDLRANAELEISGALAGLAGSTTAIERRPAPEGFAACTWDANDRFYSHRRGDAGRNLNYIYLKAEE